MTAWSWQQLVASPAKLRSQVQPERAPAYGAVPRPSFTCPREDFTKYQPGVGAFGVGA